MKMVKIAFLGTALLLIMAACSSETPTPEVIVVTSTPEAPTVPPPTVAPPTEAPPPTAIPGDPAAALGEPNGRDTFDNANNWTLFNNDCFASTITGGRFVMEAKGAPELSCWEVSWPQIKDYYYQSEVIMPAECNASDRFGLFFRAPDNDRGFLFGIQCDGKHSLTSWDGETTNVLVPVSDNNVVLTAPESLNVIGVLADGATLSIYANGTFLAQVQNVAYADAGKIGYFVRAAVEDEGFVVQYDNLAVWVLDQ